jgi:hypothetical protein
MIKITKDKIRFLQEKSQKESTGLPSLGHRHAHFHKLSRRQFLKSGAVVMGTSAMPSIFQSAFFGKGSPGSGIPSQINTFSPILADPAAFGIEIPFHLPVEIDPFLGVFDPVADPSTMTDFNGTIGVVEIEGISSATDNSDGVQRVWAADVRFMQGRYKDREGNMQYGTHAFF